MNVSYYRRASRELCVISYYIRIKSRLFEIDNSIKLYLFSNLMHRSSKCDYMYNSFFHHREHARHLDFDSLAILNSIN